MAQPVGEKDRRDFIRASAAAALAAGLAHRSVHAAGGEEIKVALIGCGGRGNGAAVNAMAADPRVRLVAIADVFADRVDNAKKSLSGSKQYAVKDENAFVGFDAYKKVLGLDLDYVILATPPHFRPLHLAAAIDAGKHVFMEKPVAVDPVGCRSVMDSGKKADEKSLKIAAGTQRRHEKVYHELYQRVLDGAIGEIVSARCYWNMGQLWFKERQSAWSPMEWMIRDWVNWSWLSGDHIVEQHVHNLDVVNWFLTKDGTSAHPIRAVGSGGRAHRVTGDQYDYFAIDFEYDGGLHVASYARQVNGCDNNVSESIVGSKGSTYSQSSFTKIVPLGGATPVTFAARRLKQTDPYVQEHIDLIEAITKNKKLNEANNIATSTLTAIMGRLAAYSGRSVTWDEMMKSNLKLGPAEYTFNVPLPKVQVPVAGRA